MALVSSVGHGGENPEVKGAGGLPGVGGESVEGRISNGAVSGRNRTTFSQHHIIFCNRKILKRQELLWKGC